MIRPELKRVYKFPGGLHIDDNKAVSSQAPIQQIAIAKKLVVPIRQHAGVPSAPCVNVGDLVKKGQIIANAVDTISLTTHAPTSGKVIAIEKTTLAHPSNLQEICIHIKTDGEDEWYLDYDPIDNYHQTSGMDLRSYIRKMGIAGLGGAVFPTDVKLSPGPQRKIDTLIINGAECEPYITCDDRLMQERAMQIVHGIKIVLHILECDHCIIGIEDNKPDAIIAMNKAIQKQNNDQIEVTVIPTLYPSGGEKQLIKVLTNKEVPSRGIPADIGLVCLNVGTCHAIFQAIHQDQPLISRIVTITGKGCNTPGNYEVLIGTPIEDFIAEAGGMTQQAERIIVGGPMMGFTLQNLQAPLVKSSNCIIVACAQEFPEPKPEQNCIRCSACVEVCPALLLPQQLYWYAKSKNYDRLEDQGIGDCIECGCCAYVCPSHIPLVQYYRFAKSQIRQNTANKKKADSARKRHEFRDFRIKQAKKERERKLAEKRAALKAKANAGGGADAAKKKAIAAAIKRAQQKKRLKVEEAKVVKDLERM